MGVRAYAADTVRRARDLASRALCGPRPLFARDVLRSADILSDAGVKGVRELAATVRRASRNRPDVVLVPPEALRRLVDANVDPLAVPFSAAQVIDYILDWVPDASHDALVRYSASRAVAEAYVSVSESRDSGAKRPPLRATVGAILVEALRLGKTPLEAADGARVPFVCKPYAMHAAREFAAAVVAALFVVPAAALMTWFAVSTGHGARFVTFLMRRRGRVAAGVALLASSIGVGRAWRAARARS